MTAHRAIPDDILALALGPADLDLEIDATEIVLSRHAVQRYRERVDGVPRRLAAERLRRLMTGARWRSRPLPWTEVVLHPGVVYGYSPDRPDVCLLLRGRVLVTVLSRRFLRRMRSPADDDDDNLVMRSVYCRARPRPARRGPRAGRAVPSGAGRGRS